MKKKSEEPRLPEWECEKSLPCSCRPEPMVHFQKWLSKDEYRWVCRNCGHGKQTM